MKTVKKKVKKTVQKITVYTLAGSNGDGSATITAYPSEEARVTAIEKDRGVKFEDLDEDDFISSEVGELGSATITIVNGEIEEFSLYIEGV